MIKNLSYYIFVASIALFLSGCSIQTKKQSVLVKKVKSETKQLQLKNSTKIIPSTLDISSQLEQLTKNKKYHEQVTSQEQYYNWDKIIQFMVNKMLQTTHLNLNNLLLVDNVNDCTNSFLNTKEVTETLHNILSNSNRFTLISTQQLITAKKQLGISLQDNLNSRSKTVGIARIIGAQYILYSNIINGINTLILQMQLILVQTGEIIWSIKGNIAAYY